MKESSQADHAAKSREPKKTYSGTDVPGNVLTPAGYPVRCAVVPAAAETLSTAVAAAPAGHKRVAEVSTTRAADSVTMEKGCHTPATSHNPDA